MISFAALSLRGWLLTACAAAALYASAQSAPQKDKSASPNREAGLAAWQQVYSVLTHPRCVNCHTATEYPQQGDDRHRHLFNVVRGPGGKGVPGLNCATCHQEANADSTGVPGAHNWHLAPLSMKWQDAGDKLMSSSEVCKSLIDPSKNDHLDGAGLLKHHQTEALVQWAFQPGLTRDGKPRTPLPMTHADFVSATKTWVAAGTPCP